MLKNKYAVISIYFIIIVLAIFLRVYRLSDIPPGVNRDEADIGFTASSLLHTGKDEYGRAFPLSFQSFGDWKLPIYIYETVISVSVFGLNTFAVRIPSAIAGIITVALAFFLFQELFHKKKLSLLAMLLFAIAPWSLHLSRVESESNTAVLFVVLGTLLFMKARKGKSWMFIPAAILFSLTYFTYAGNYIFTTLYVIGLALFYYKDIPKTKYLLSAVGIFIIMSIFIGVVTLGANHTKLAGIGILSDPSIVHAKIEIPRNEHTNPNSFLARLVNNRVVFVGERFLQNYINSYSANFLFINGGTNHAHNIENFGNMYLIESIFLFLGLVFLITLQRGTGRKLVLWWFFIAPLAASITKDAPHTNRTAAIIPMLPLIVAFGIFWFVSFTKKRYLQYLFSGIIVLLFFVNFCIYLDQYYVLFPRNEAQYWGKPYQDLSVILSKSKYSKKHIIMSQPETSPYIYLMFYENYDPKSFQHSVVRYPITSDGFINVKSFGRYEFRTIDWTKDLHTSNNLLIDVTENVSQSIRNDYKTTDIILPSQQQIFTIVETK